MSAGVEHRTHVLPSQRSTIIAACTADQQCHIIHLPPSSQAICYYDGSLMSLLKSTPTANKSSQSCWPKTIYTLTYIMASTRLRSILLTSKRFQFGGSWLLSSASPRWLPAACKHIRPHAYMPSANTLANVNANAQYPCQVPMLSANLTHTPHTSCDSAGA